MLLLIAATVTLAEVRPDAPPAAAPVTAEQQERLEERDSLYLETKNFWQQGRFDKAVAAAEKMLALERDVLGPDHEDVVRTLDLLARIAESRRDYTAARAARRQVLEIQVKRYGDSHWRTIDAQLALAREDRLAKLTRAQHRRLDAAEAANRDLEKTFHLGMFDGLTAAAQEIVETREELLGKDDPDVAVAVNNLGMIHAALGDYSRAEPVLFQALEMRERVLGKGHPAYAASLNNVALLSYYRGDYLQAEPRLGQVARIMEEAVGAGTTDHAVALNNLAVLYGAMGDYARAESLLGQAVQVGRKATDDVAAGESKRPPRLGLYQAVMGDYNWTETLSTFLGVHVGVGEPDDEAADDWNAPIFLNNLAGLYLVLGDDRKAEPLLRESLELIQTTGGDNYPNYGTALGNLALLYYRRGDYDEAERLLRQALEIRKKSISSGGERHPKYATCLNNLGLVSYARGDFARAETYWRQALKLRETVLGENHPSCALILSNLAAARDAQGDPADAAALLKRALDVARRHLEETYAVQGERQQVVLTETLRGLLDQYLSVAPRASLPAGDVYPYLLAWKGAVFASQSRQRRADAAADPKTAAMFADLGRVSQELANLAFAAPEPGPRQTEWRRRVADLSRRKEEIETDLASRGQKPPAPPTVDRLQAVLPRDGALVDFLEYTHFAPPESGKGKLQKERRLVAFVVRPGAEVRRVDLGPAAPVTAAVDRWRKTLGRKSSDDDDDPGAELRRRAWQPLEEALKGVQLVAVSPDGALGRFPLAALPGGKAGTFLLEEKALVLVPAPQLLPETLGADAPGGDPSMLLVGDVDYDGAAGRPADPAGMAWAARGARAGAPFTWPALPGTRAELKGIKELFTTKFPEGGLVVLQGAGATEAGVRKEAPARRWLHVATHGFFAPAQLRSVFGEDAGGDKPGEAAAAPPLLGRGGVAGFHPGLLSGVVLAGANRKPEPGQDDGVLTALEVASLDLHKVDLAVLSACETGLGQEAGGEGMLGLQRAFQVAGARTTVTSLWQVSDDPTRVLMERFYSNLWDKKTSKAEALREAQLWMLREGRAHTGVQRGFVADQDKGWDQEGRLPPFYWAAFVLSGDWR